MRTSGPGFPSNAGPPRKAYTVAIIPLLLAILSASPRHAEESLNGSYTRVPIEKTQGIRADFSFPVYLADEVIGYSADITNTTQSAFAVDNGRTLDDVQLIWIPFRDGKAIEFCGETAFVGGGDFFRSPLEVVDSNLRVWSVITKERQGEFDTIFPGESRTTDTYSNGWLDTNPSPDTLVPYLMTNDRLLVGPPVPINVDPRKAKDFPAVSWEGEAHAHNHDIREVELAGQKFLFLGRAGSYRMCRIPIGLQYRVKLSLDPISRQKGGTWTRQTMTVSFPGSNEPDFVGMLQVPQTIQGTPETDPKLWAKSLPNRSTPAPELVEPAVETSGKASPAPEPATTGKQSFWLWIALAAGCLMVLVATLLFFRRKG